MIPAAVVGATGYTGQELAQLLLTHPEFEIAALFGSGRGGRVSSFSNEAPSFRGLLDLSVEPSTAEAIVASGARAVFLATPHEVSASLAPELLEMDRELVVIDLSGAFRLKSPGAYPEHYGFEHRTPGLLERAVYGLPELDRSGLAGVGRGGSRLVACAGCYVTAATIPLAALVRAGVLDVGQRPIIDATSGVSGAGRGAKLSTSYCEVSQSVYGAAHHRHRPEIEQALGRRVIFQPHLGPYERGILATMHARLAPGVGLREVTGAFHGAYGTECFVRLLGPVTGPESPVPSVGGVVRTNVVDVAWKVDEGDVTVYSALDNLVKGASGQALQCANVVFGIEESTGLFPCGTRLRATAMKGAL